MPMPRNARAPQEDPAAPPVALMSPNGEKRIRFVGNGFVYLVTSLLVGFPVVTVLVTFFPHAQWFILGLWALTFFWRRGVTIDLERRIVRSWFGPGFPVIWTNFPLDAYDAVSVVTDTFEVHSRHQNLRAFHTTDTRRYGAATSLKLVARLTPQTRYPEDLPRPLELPLPTIKSWLRGTEKYRHERGEALARALGVDFMDVR